jgi:hypothetical protein
VIKAIPGTTRATKKKTWGSVSGIFIVDAGYSADWAFAVSVHKQKKFCELKSGSKKQARLECWPGVSRNYSVTPTGFEPVLPP